MELQSGIYAITSPSGKRYIGSTKNFARRWREHRSDLALGRHSSLRLQRAHDKYGLDALRFEILLRVPVADLLECEQTSIDQLRPEYNCALIVNRPVITEESRRKMSLARRGVPRSDYHKRRTSEGLKGYVKTPEHLANIALSRRTNPNYEAMCAAQSARSKGRPSPFKGVPSGRTPSPEARAQQGATLSATRSTSGFRGVSLNAQKGLWKAVKRVGDARKFLGYFESKDAAWAAICDHGGEIGYIKT